MSLAEEAKARLKAIGTVLLIAVVLPVALYWLTLYACDWADFNLYIWMKNHHLPTYWLATSPNDYWARKLPAWIVLVVSGVIAFKQAIKVLVDMLD